MKDRYQNKKTKDIYCILSKAIDCTNQRDGTLVVIYYPEADPKTLYVREEKEFDMKFEFID